MSFEEDIWMKFMHRNWRKNHFSIFSFFHKSLTLILHEYNNNLYCNLMGSLVKQFKRTNYI
jgi:hypothetical protein